MTKNFTVMTIGRGDDEWGRIRFAKVVGEFSTFDRALGFARNKFHLKNDVEWCVTHKEQCYNEIFKEAVQNWESANEG